MNSSFSGNTSYSNSTSSLKNYDFDFGIGSTARNSSRPLKDQKNPNPSVSSTASRPSYQHPTSSSSSWASSKPSWTHQPSSASTNTVPGARSGLTNPSPSSSSSMVGDIFGKSWNSAAPSSGIGLPKSDPNLFGDLLGSALGGGKGGGNVPLKSVGQQQQQNNVFAMGNMASSLPKTNTAATSVPVPVPSTTNVNPMRPASYAGSVGNSMSGAKLGTSMGAPSMKSSSATSGSSAMNQNRDPFGSLMDFKPKASAASASASVNSNTKVKVAGGDDPFGSFQNANIVKDDTFGFIHTSNIPKNDDTFGSFHNASAYKDGTFGMPEFSSQKKPSTSSLNNSNGVDPLDMLFSSIPSKTADDGSAGVQGRFEETNDWDLGADFGGGDGGGATTELEGLPPPPAGVTASAAKSKGLDSHKQGQFADAIKWLSWATVLLEKAGDKGAIAEVLTCRASCYKEVGEYKKAVADCTKVLEHDDKNVTVLVQRALLYESTEKYKLGAEDLRAVLKIDPMNRLARTTIHRLTQLAG